MKTKDIKIKLGQKLFRTTFPSKLLEYRVYGILYQEDGIHYLLECLSCNHGTEKCRLQIILKNSQYTFEKMLDEFADAEEHTCWHKDGEYFTDKILCLDNYLCRQIIACRNEITKHEEEILKANDCIKQLEAEKIKLTK